MMLDDKTVVVTGVGGGLGRECATSALRNGANVVIAARSGDTLATIAKELDPSGKSILAHVTDITDAGSCQALADAATERFGHVDALVQVAAYELVWGDLYHLRFEDWQKAFETNVLGALTVLRPLASAMKDAGGGSVVLIGSQSMFKPSLPQSGYAASKGALLSTMYYLADELGPDNIRVNMVVPSWMWGPNVEMYVNGRARSEGRQPADVLDEITGSFPLRRMTEDGEVADVCAFFVSDLAKAVTGQYLMVNSGEMSR